MKLILVNRLTKLRISMRIVLIDGIVVVLCSKPLMTMIFLYPRHQLDCKAFRREIASTSIGVEACLNFELHDKQYTPFSSLTIQLAPIVS